MNVALLCTHLNHKVICSTSTHLTGSFAGVKGSHLLDTLLTLLGYDALADTVLRCLPHKMGHVLEYVVCILRTVAVTHFDALTKPISSLWDVCRDFSILI